MRSPRAVLAAALLSAGVLVSCATTPFAAREATILSVLELINAADPSGIRQASVAPFLFDAEILTLDSDVRALWGLLSDAGFTITDPEVVATSEITPGSYMQFSNSMDARVFFERDVPPGAVIARIAAAEGEFVLILEGRRSGYPDVLGFKGPIR